MHVCMFVYISYMTSSKERDDNYDDDYTYYVKKMVIFFK